MAVKRLRLCKHVMLGLTLLACGMFASCAQLNDQLLVEMEEEPVVDDVHNPQPSPSLGFLQERSLELPLQLPVLTSHDARTILQYGDILLRMDPIRTDLYWIDQFGNIINQVRDRYTGDAVLDMSAEGITAVAGADFFAAHDDKLAEIPLRERSAVLPTYVDLYDQEGARLWSHSIEAGRRVELVRVLPDQKRVVVLTASAQDPLTENRIQIVDEGGVQRGFAEEFGVIQKVVVLGEGQLAFIQTSQGHGVVNLASAEPLWFREEPVRLISPYGAVLGADPDELLLMTGERLDPSQGLYQWTLQVLRLRNGEVLGSTTLDEPYPSTWGDVFVEVGEETVIVLAGDQELSVRLPPRES